MFRRVRWRQLQRLRMFAWKCQMCSDPQVCEGKTLIGFDVWRKTLNRSCFVRFVLFRVRRYASSLHSVGMARTWCVRISVFPTHSGASSPWRWEMLTKQKYIRRRSTRAHELGSIDVIHHTVSMFVHFHLWMKLFHSSEIKKTDRNFHHVVGCAKYCKVLSRRKNNSFLHKQQGKIWSGVCVTFVVI